MTVETPETMDEKELLDDFKSRYTKLRDENQQLVAKVKENETQMLKLQGAIETLEYLKTNTVDEVIAEYR